MSCEHCPEGSHEWSDYEIMDWYSDNSAIHIVCKHCERKGVIYLTLDDDIDWEVTA